jgi:hypothetical protein
VRARLTDAEAESDAGARTRSGLREVRQGVAIPLPGATWTTPPPAPLANRARVIDAGEAVEPHPGDVLLIRGSADLGTLPLDQLAAVVTDGTFTGATDLPTGEGWDLTHAQNGLLVSIPSADGAANAALWI